MIITFYSFKGGVGRSMAVANVADILARRGFKVLMIDFDLEAPGLEQYFQIKQGAAQRHDGLLDLLLAYKRSMSVAASATADQFRNVERFIVPVYEQQLAGGGRLDLMPAGQRETREQLERYAANLRSFDWQDFYTNWEGELFFEWLRAALVPVRYDLVIVDSRTGVTEMGGICTYQLADAIFMLTASNHQNRQGTLNVAVDFESVRVQSARRERPLDILVVPARVEQRDPKLADPFVADFERQFAAYLPARIRDAGLGFRDLLIPYEPAYAFEERVLSDPTRAVERRSIAGSFERLADAVCALAPRREGATPAAEVTRPTTPVVAQFDAAKRFAGYDAFIAYASGDSELGHALGDRLRDLDAVVFEDRLELAHGEDWKARTEQALFHSRLCLACYGGQGLTPSQGTELVTLCEAIAGSRDLVIVPVLLPGATDESFRQNAPPALQRLMCLDLRKGLDTSEGREGLARLVTSQRPQSTTPVSTAPAGSRAEPTPTAAFGAPYPGARPFTEADAGFLFGRDTVVADVVKTLERTRLALITGPSACGKTSLVEAGVVAALRAVSGPLEYARLVVGDVPLASIEEALERQSSTVTGRHLLFIDQVERLLRHSSIADVRRFLERVGGAAARPGGPLLILAIRDARVSELAAASGGALLDASHTIRVPPLREPELRQAIERPAEKAGLAFEPGLVDRIVSEFGQEQRFLPFLQVILLELCNRRREGFLTNHAYSQIEDPLEAIAERAWDALSAELKPTAERLIPRLLTLCGNLSDLELSCRPSDLLLSDMPESHLKAVIWHMVDRSLFYAFADEKGQARVAPAFVAEQWDRAAAWLQRKDRSEFYAWLPRLDSYRRDWERNARDQGALLSGELLREATRWRTNVGGDLSRAEIEFIDGSERHQSRMRRTQVAAAAVMVAILIVVIAINRWNAWQEAATHDRVAVLLADGDRQFADGDSTAAIANYTNALQIAPDDTTLLMRRAVANDGVKKYDEALADLGRVIEITSASKVEGAQALLADAYDARAATNLHRNQPAAALADLDEAAKNNPKNANIQSNRATVLERMGRNDEALRAYGHALQLQPDFAEAIFARGALNEKLGRRAEAERDDQTVAKLSSATAQTQVAARTRLQRLGSTVIQKTEQTRVTIRVTDRKDMEVAQKVADALKEKQFTIDKIEALDAPARGEVRYYFNEDERAAEQIRLITESVIAEGGYIVQLPSNFAATKERINPGAVEVSLPSLSAQLIRPSYRRFEARKKS